MRAGVYVRISDDQTGRAAGVARQEEDCRGLAKRLGWDVAQVYSDNDITASKSKRRPAYERMWKDAEAGQIGAVIVWHPDRLYRKPIDLEALITLIEKTQSRIATVTAGDVDLTTPTGRMQARIAVAVFKHETERTSERVKRERAQRVAETGWGGGGRRPFGYNIVDPDGQPFISYKRARRTGETPSQGKARLVVNKAEADILQSAARSYIGAASLYSIVSRWNVDGIRSASGKTWSTSLLQQTLRKEHPGIISDRDHKLVLARLGDNHFGRGKGPRPGARRGLLSGLIRCECGRKMVKSGDFYRCTVANGGCGKVSIKLETLEDYIRRTARERIPDEDESAESTREHSVDEAILDEIAALEARLDELAGQFAEGSTFATKVAVKVEAEIAKLRKQLTGKVPKSGTNWAELGRWTIQPLAPDLIAILRNAIADVIIDITVKKGRRGLDPSKRIRVRWAA